MNEFELIDYLTDGFPQYHAHVVQGIGDDCAVWKEGRETVLFTTDAMVEGDHFFKSWFSPEQIGERLIESNVSDIAAMGGEPAHLFLSLIIDDQTPPEWLRKMYEGVKKSSQKYQISLLGGNVTHGLTLSITVGLYGYGRGKLLFRHGAKAGDLVVVTGTIGSACVARLMLKKGAVPPQALFNRLALPQARVSEALQIKPYANAMIDISDGIASEARHLAKESKLGVRIDATKIPYQEEALGCRDQLDQPLLDCAMRGGEDYELMFTITPKKLRMLYNHYALKTPLTVIGEMTSSLDCLYLDELGKIRELPAGFDHFGKNINL